jgi:hypothetical protein
MLISGQMIGMVLLLCSIVLTCVISLAKVTFVTTDHYLKKRVFKNEEICHWEWIYAVKTEKSSTTGIYTTFVSWTKLDHAQLKDFLTTSNVCNENIGKMLVTSHVAGYRQLLKEIVTRSNASLDESTTVLVNEQTR